MAHEAVAQVVAELGQDAEHCSSFEWELSWKTSLACECCGPADPLFVGKTSDCNSVSACKGAQSIPLFTGGTVPDTTYSLHFADAFARVPLQVNDS